MTALAPERFAHPSDQTAGIRAAAFERWRGSCKVVNGGQKHCLEGQHSTIHCQILKRPPETIRGVLKHPASCHFALGRAIQRKVGSLGINDLGNGGLNGVKAGS